MTDRDFDQLLYQGADQLPPKSVEQTSPAPWRQALLLICWGIALSLIHISSLKNVFPSPVSFDSALRSSLPHLGEALFVKISSRKFALSFN